MTLAPPRPIGLAEFALRVATRRDSGDWLALIVREPLDPSQVADRLAEEIATLGGEAVERVSSAAGAAELTEHAARAADRVVVLSGLEALSEREWRHLDHLRSLWERTGSVVLVLHPATAKALVDQAPNVVTWIGSAMWYLDPAADRLPDEARRARVEALEAWAGRTSDEVVQLAVQGTLPPDPEYAEWLILLGRGDLLER